ncbi:YciI family protein [soil metagenome]
MQYMLLLHANESAILSATPEQGAGILAQYGAYSEALRKAGVLLSSNRLRPSTATTSVSVKDGKTEVLNGPYVETREQLGGYYLIDVADLDAALSWAARCPGASQGGIEVRPIWAM